MKTLFWRFRFAKKMMSMGMFNSSRLTNFHVGWIISSEALDRFGVDYPPHNACSILINEWFKR
jgi:hypothetical protein